MKSIVIPSEQCGASLLLVRVVCGLAARAERNLQLILRLVDLSCSCYGSFRSGEGAGPKSHTRANRKPRRKIGGYRNLSRILRQVREVTLPTGVAGPRFPRTGRAHESRRRVPHPSFFEGWVFVLPLIFSRPPKTKREAISGLPFLFCFPGCAGKHAYVRNLKSSSRSRLANDFWHARFFACQKSTARSARLPYAVLFPRVVSFPAPRRLHALSPALLGQNIRPCPDRPSTAPATPGRSSTSRPESPIGGVAAGPTFSSSASSSLSASWPNTTCSRPASPTTRNGRPARTSSRTLRSARPSPERPASRPVLHRLAKRQLTRTVGTNRRLPPAPTGWPPVQLLRSQSSEERLPARENGLTVPTHMPLTYTRSYYPLYDWSQRFQIFLPNVYNLFLTGHRYPYSDINWSLPDNQIIHFDRVSSGTGYADAVFEAAASDPDFTGARQSWNGFGWDLSTPNGMTYLSPEAYNSTRPQQGSLVGIFDSRRRSPPRAPTKWRSHRNRCARRWMDQAALRRRAHHPSGRYFGKDRCLHLRRIAPPPSFTEQATASAIPTMPITASFRCRISAPAGFSKLTTMPAASSTHSTSVPAKNISSAIRSSSPPTSFDVDVTNPSGSIQRLSIQVLESKSYYTIQPLAPAQHPDANPIPPRR